MNQQTETDADSGILERVKAYQEIKGRLREQLGHRWEPGVRLPPIKQLARELKIGQTNTHRAVRELAKEGLLVSRPGQGTFVTDKVHAQRHMGPWQRNQGELPVQGSALKGKWAEVLVTALEPDRFIREMTDAFEMTIGRYGCRITRALFDFSGKVPLGNNCDADAVVVVNPNFTRFEVKSHQVLTVISTSMDLLLPVEGRYDVVSVDAEQGGMVAGDYLKQCGGIAACFLGVHSRNDAGMPDKTSQSRLTGFERGWGAPVPQQHQLLVDSYMTKYGAKAVAEYLKLDSRPDVVFAASDELGVGFVHGALAHGLEPGRDYQIIGFDGQQLARDLAGGPLTTIAVPGREMGELAGALLTQRLLNPAHNVRRVMLGCNIEPGVTTRQ